MGGWQDPSGISGDNDRIADLMSSLALSVSPHPLPTLPFSQSDSTELEPCSTASLKR